MANPKDAKMKSNRSRLLTNFTAMAALAMTAGMCFAEGDAPEAGAPAASTTKATRAPAANFLPIVRGRLPLLFVHAIRFDSTLNAMGNKDLATKFGTSVGKVFDIKKGRNFAYVDASFKPSAEDIAAAEAWIAQVGATNAKGVGAAGDKTVMQTVMDEYKGKGLATAEEVAAFSAARGATRAKPAAKTAGGALPTAGQTPDQGVQQTASATADDLLG